ncbi:MAG: DUF2281 domain-containing protein [Planctomycetota bacterium]|nr:DUF2281 domain-containing protein [Planctomycetota bacterium]
MTVAEQIINHIKSMPEAVQAEVLDFVCYLETKREKAKTENTEWSDLSLSHAMRGMESESSLYSLDDVKENLS